MTTKAAATTQVQVATDEQRWQAVERRDRTAEGSFLIALKTTGIFCRPGCPARTPLRKNVEFFTTAAEARAAGYRACKRCKPEETPQSASSDSRMHEIAAWLRRHAEEPGATTLASLGTRFGLSPFHLQRSFKAVFGVSPRRYIEARRVDALKERLRDGSSVTAAVFDAGFSSASPMHRAATRRLGMTPREFRAGGERLSISYATLDTPLGLVMLGATDRGLCFVEFGSAEADLLQTMREEFPRADIQPMPQPHSPAFTAWAETLRAYLQGERDRHRAKAIPLTLHGTAFQTAVWQYLQTIPAGTVQTYTQVAAAIGRPRAVRAVASACAANRIAVLIPCHRVLRGDGGMGGYRWGVERKRRLLQSEATAAQTAKRPVEAASLPSL